MTDETKKAVDEVMSAFNEFKQSNDKLLQAKADGKAVGDLTAKVETINSALDKFEDVNQKVTLAGQQAKSMQEQMDRIETIINRPNLGAPGASAQENREFMAAFDRVMRSPADQRQSSDVQLIQRRAALVAGNDAGAGYLLMPAEIQAGIIKDVIEQTPIRAIATVRSIGGPSLKMPKKVGNGAASRVGEVSARSNTGDPSYGMLEFIAPEMFARIEVSQQMLEDSAYDLLAELREDAATQFAVREGLESISGLGAANQMEGILVNPDIATTVSGSAALITADGMHDLFYGLKTAHSRNGMFGMNRTTLGAVRKLKDTTGQYLWVTGIANGAPNTILGAPYVEMADMPNVAANAFPVLFADFRKLYVIVDRVAISVQVDYTSGADNGLVVYRARKRTGGGVRQAEAGRKLKCSV